MMGRLKQDRTQSHTGYWQTAGEQTVTAEQLASHMRGLMLLTVSNDTLKNSKHN